MAKPQMNQKAKVSPSKPGTAIAKTQSAGGLPANVAAAAAKHSGKGISDKIEDNIVPLIYLLQANSKPAMKGHEKFIPGAEGGGVIWLRNEPKDDCLINGDDGMLFQPCHFSKCWLEWLPDRGGFVARHQDRPAVAELQDIEGDDGSIRKGWRMPNGNVVNESREFAGFVHFDDSERGPLMYTLPMTGSNHSVGKAWMTSMRNERLPDDSRAPIFANIYRVKTKLRTSGENSWFMYEIEKEGAVQTVEDIERGAALYDAFESGSKQSAVADDDVDVASTTGGEIDD